jgi:hypothetical protein
LEREGEEKEGRRGEGRRGEQRRGEKRKAYPITTWLESGPGMKPNVYGMRNSRSLTT